MILQLWLVSQKWVATLRSVMRLRLLGVECVSRPLLTKKRENFHHPQAHWVSKLSLQMDPTSKKSLRTSGLR